MPCSSHCPRSSGSGPRCPCHPSAMVPKFIPTKFSSMFKKFGKHKPPVSRPSSSNPSLVQQQSSRAPTPNPMPSLAIQPLADRSATEAAYNVATSVAAPTSNPISSRSDVAPTSHSVAKDTAVNALKLLLNLASDIPGPGVKPALSGLLTIIERVQVCCRNIPWLWTLRRSLRKPRTMLRAS
jgi:hypothetical protein